MIDPLNPRCVDEFRQALYSCSLIELLVSLLVLPEAIVVSLCIIAIALRGSFVVLRDA